MQIDGINHADDGGVDGRVGAANGGHGGETFRCEQDTVADSRAHRVEREDGIAAIRAVELKRLDDEDLAPFVGRGLLVATMSPMTGPINMRGSVESNAKT